MPAVGACARFIRALHVEVGRIPVGDVHVPIEAPIALGLVHIHDHIHRATLHILGFDLEGIHTLRGILIRYLGIPFTAGAATGPDLELVTDFTDVITHCVGFKAFVILGEGRRGCKQGSREYKSFHALF